MLSRKPAHGFQLDDALHLYGKIHTRTTKINCQCQVQCLISPVQTKKLKSWIGILRGIMGFLLLTVVSFLLFFSFSPKDSCFYYLASFGDTMSLCLIVFRERWAFVYKIFGICLWIPFLLMFLQCLELLWLVTKPLNYLLWYQLLLW